MANSIVCQSKWKPVVKPRQAKPKTYRQAPTYWLKFYEEAATESEDRTAVVQKEWRIAINNVGHLVSSPNEREKRDRKDCKGDEKEGQVRKWKIKVKKQKK